MRTTLLFFLLIMSGLAIGQPSTKNNSLQVKTANGILEGTEESGIRIFKGIPFAQPPVGELRWQAPQPAQSWEGVRKADSFGPRAMQRPLFGDMVFRSDGVSEDCLYLNVWTPARSADEKLPVLVYFYGGGLMAGDGSEPRYDGESMARQGIVALTVNYRLSLFGFFAHPELTQESPHRSSGNYGFLDQQAALQWVQENIAAFGGDPSRVTIAGESAGSFSVSAQMASPLSRDLMAGAIGESGSLLGSFSPVSLDTAEQYGVRFARQVGASSLAELRAMPAEQLLEATANPNTPRFPVVIDGWFFPEPPMDIYTEGQQAQIPLLLGWNSQEMGHQMIMGNQSPTPENYTAAVEKLYGDQADEVLALYPATTAQEAQQSATDLAGDRFIGFSTWKWGEVHAQSSDQPVYRYYYTRPRPAMRNQSSGKDTPPPAQGAVHSAEIEYAMGNLPTNRVYDWQPEDFRVSEVMQGYFVNFIRNGDPNGLGLPEWPAMSATDTPQVMYIGEETQAQPEQHRDRYQFMDQ